MPHAALWVVQRNYQHNAALYRHVSMPHAALWVVQLEEIIESLEFDLVSMPHAALWVVQQLKWKRKCYLLGVSMPHAALWVVQHQIGYGLPLGRNCFNAARGFVGGATASLAALVPLRGKSPFGKSPEI